MITRRTALALPVLLGALDAMAAPTDSIVITRKATVPSIEGKAPNFTGAVQIDGRFQAPDPARSGGGLVTFQPGARTAWHTHPLGQTLVITSGVGRIQMWGGDIKEVLAGDVVWIPPGIKHWHGAAPTDSMSHFGVAEAL